MKIVELRAENFKRLKAVRIKPDGSLVQITGENGAGKSSVLDAVWAALGGKSASPEKPIRDGQKKAEVTLDLGEYVVTRKWTKSDSYLEVTSKDGAVVQSPQAMLDKIVGRLTFDPLEFSRMAAAQQAATLRAVVGLDVSDLDAAEKAAYASRTLANRDVENLTARLKAQAGPFDVPDKTVDVSSLAAQLEAANQVRRRNDAQRATAKNLREAAKNQAVNADRAKRQYQAELDHAEQLERQAVEAEAAAAKLIDPNTEEIAARIADADSVNQKVRWNAQRASISAELDTAVESAEALTEKIEAARAEKLARIAAAKMPVVGLALADDGVTFNGIPFGQCSSAEQLRVSVALGMANNPKLRTMTIRDGSLLDSASMKLLGSLCEEHDYQVLIERVASGEKVGIVIEDGEVAS